MWMRERVCLVRTRCAAGRVSWGRATIGATGDDTTTSCSCYPNTHTHRHRERDTATSAPREAATPNASGGVWSCLEGGRVVGGEGQHVGLLSHRRLTHRAGHTHGGARGGAGGRAGGRLDTAQEAAQGRSAPRGGSSLEEGQKGGRQGRRGHTQPCSVSIQARQNRPGRRLPRNLRLATHLVSPRALDALRRAHAHLSAHQAGSQT